MPTKPPRHDQPKRPRHVTPYARPEQLAEFYNSIRWQNCRNMYRAQHPLCADPFGTHQKEGRVVPADHVHHIKPLRISLADGLDFDNLMSLCASCHALIDAQLRKVVQ